MIIVYRKAAREETVFVFDFDASMIFPFALPTDWLADCSFNRISHTANMRSLFIINTEEICSRNRGDEIKSKKRIQTHKAYIHILGLHTRVALSPPLFNARSGKLRKKK